jgi:hypothetical protein
VNINELVVAVNVARGPAPLSDCPSLGVDGSWAVTVDELITAVANAQNGCGSGS